jgi:hypothetical protein
MEIIDIAKMADIVVSGVNGSPISNGKASENRQAEGSGVTS